MLDLVIKSNFTVTSSGVNKAYVLIKDGKIADIANNMPESNDYDLVDIGDKVLLPGIIDPHVHINEPGRTEWEGFETATLSAIAGGITTIADMPLNSKPVTTSVTAFIEKLSATRNQLHTNCGFWGGIVPGNENEIENLIYSGVLGFKAFLIHSGIEEFPNVTETELRKVMPVIAKHNLPLLVHCELSSNLPDRQAPLSELSNNSASYKNYLASRPKNWEDKGIALMIRLCEEYNCPVHIVHLSSSGSIGQLAKAKEKDLPLTIETAQHYLYFNAEDIKDGETQFKCAPPIRERVNNDLLWKALKQGLIDFVATDHSPAPPELKQYESGDFTKAWGGIASLQLSLPALWTAAKKRNAGLTDIARWLCENPARLMNLQNNKGKIAKGYDADLIVFDAEKTFTVTEKMIHHKHPITPYLNHELHGVVEQTFLGGINVYNNGRFTQLNKGKVITRQPDERL